VDLEAGVSFRPDLVLRSTNNRLNRTLLGPIDEET
jgi:hypothetical protein